MSANDKNPNEKAGGLDRRDFLKCSALLGGAAFASQLGWALGLVKKAEAGTLPPEVEYELAKAENILRTSCLQCNTGCGIKVKVHRFLDGGAEGAYALKIDGDPASPFSSIPHSPYASSPAELATVDMPICPKGQAGLQTVYDPYRITSVLKRAGKRGEGKWVTIPFAQAISEIVNGGALFSEVPGEEGRTVGGLKEIYALRDPKAMTAMGTDAKAIAKATDKAAAVAAFKTKYADKLGYLIDPDHPDLGPKNNQLVYSWGRIKGGRTDLALRLVRDYFGSANFHGHTTVCQGSLYFASKACSEQYSTNTFSGGSKFYWQADLENAEFVLFVGANLFDANYGPPNRGGRLLPNVASGKMKIAVADPRFSKLASKANYYLPVKPGTDGALFSGILRFLFDNQEYDKGYLACANKAAATAAGEPTFCNATWLVKIGSDGRPGKFLRAHEAGLVPAPAAGGAELLTVLDGRRVVAVDPNSTTTPVTGKLFVDTVVNGVRVKSSLQILKEEVEKKSLPEWAELCGVPAGSIAAVAQELTSHGKRACVDIHRGVSQHANGFYNVTLAWSINMLLGNYDWKGGMLALAAYNTTGGKASQPFNFGNMTPNKLSPFGISIIRHEIKYEESTLFQGYPAPRNWWPLASDIYQEIIPSIGDQYPYPVKALMMYMGAPNYSLPGGHALNAILTDTARLPLFFCSDITVGPTSAYADYIFPDLSYLERWEFHGSHPNMPAKVQPVRQPVIAPMTETVTVYGREMPASFEALILGIAEKLGLPGFGPNGLGAGMDLCHPDDFYLRMVANIATDDTPVPDADGPLPNGPEERLLVASRRHLPPTVFDAARWQAITGASWKKVVYVLNRGGRYQDYDKQFSGEQAANKYGKLINLYQEKTAGTKNAFTGKPNAGYGTYVPVTDALGRSPEAAGLVDGYPLHLITQKDILQTKSRTVVDYWLTEIEPENCVLVNPADAGALGLADGDLVRLSSATNPNGEYDLMNGTILGVVGKLRVTESIQPGVVTFSIGYGQWATGAGAYSIDGKPIEGDPKRATGFNANGVMWLDPHLQNTCMLDPVGGSAAFYDTRVKLTRAG